MSELSPATWKTLAAGTQQLYCVDPDEGPLTASELGCAIATAPACCCGSGGA